MFLLPRILSEKGQEGTSVLLSKFITNYGAVSVPPFYEAVRNHVKIGFVDIYDPKGYFVDPSSKPENLERYALVLTDAGKKFSQALPSIKLLKPVDDHFCPEEDIAAIKLLLRLTGNVKDQTTLRRMNYLLVPKVYRPFDPPSLDNREYITKGLVSAGLIKEIPDSGLCTEKGKNLAGETVKALKCAFEYRYPLYARFVSRLWKLGL